MSSRPDRPLVVRCRFDKAQKKITFSSAQNCTYGTLNQKIQQCFSLSATTYSVSWKDDDGEITLIEKEADLTEAICYFCSGDDAHSSSAASILSGRSFGRGKVTLRVDITVDYDGPSLSDTSSLVSLDEYRSRNGSHRSFSFGAPSVELDDDSVTVSSRDQAGSTSSASYRDRYLHPSNPTDEFAKTSPTIRYPLESEFSFVDDESNGHRLQSASDDSVSLNGREGVGEGTSPVSGRSEVDGVALSGAWDKYPADPSAVFERLKIREALGDDHSDRESASIEDLGARWLRDQNARAAIGVVPLSEAASDDDSFDVISLSLERNDKGQYYYNYNTSSGSQSHDSADDDGFHVLSDDDDVPPPVPSKEDEHHRPSSMHMSWVTAQRQEAEEHRRLQASASQASLRSPIFDPLKRSPVEGTTPVEDHGFKYYGLPAPPPEILTACSLCESPLESMRYVCSTCGENRPMSQSRGKRKEITSAFSYPPRPAYASTSSQGISTSPSQTLLGSTDSLPHRTMCKYKIVANHSPFSSSIFSSRTRVDTVLSDTSTGFELCVNCFESDGITHSIEAGFGSPNSSHSAFAQSSTSLQHQDSSWRTSAPKKGHARHCFTEKFWGEFGWENISDDEELVSVCTICSVTTERQRYKCAACPKFYLCRGCYGIVHQLHPSHAFIQVPDRQKAAKIEVEDLSNGHFNEPSMEHRVTCAHCLMPIVGALFHCAICESVDICSNCEAAGLPGNLEAAEGGHNSSHILLKIPYAMDHDKLQSASKAAMSLWRGRDSGVAITASQAASQNDAAFTQTVIGSSSLSTSLAEPSEDHHIPCNNCNQSIVGVRYQCAHCPSAYPAIPYNLCSHCEALSWAVHDPMHIFFKLPRPVHHALESRGAFLPPLYKVGAGPTPNSPGRSGDPRQYLKHLVHRIVLCDRCMKHIEGEWFRCACCSIDLCDECEAVDTHADNHIFVVFKSEVELQAFRAWTNPEHPAPILGAPVYDSYQ